MDNKLRQLAGVLAVPTATDEGLERLCKEWGVKRVYQRNRDGEEYLDWNIVIPRLAQHALEED